MPRAPRKKSESGIYHIIMRGINRQIIFADDEDCRKFLDTLEKYKDVCEYKIYAYCLMGNHLHLLLNEGKELLEQVMRRICGSFVYWYNRKYDRVGNLFQDRYRSEPVEDDKYFLTVIRYIFQNPVKAGLVTSIEKYRWSNYSEYVGVNRMTDVDFALGIFGAERKKAIYGFREYINKPNDDVCLDMEEKRCVTDEEAQKTVQNLYKINSPTEIKGFAPAIRDTYLRELKEKHNLSIRQIERITGINRGIIFKA